MREPVATKLTILNCKVCNAPFVRNSCSHRYCSRECAKKAEQDQKRWVGGPGKGWSNGKQFVPRRKCDMCGTDFYAPPVLVKRGGGKFCSNLCRGKFMATTPSMFPQTQSRRGRGGQREDLSGMYFRSAWEANYARYLNWMIGQKMIRKWEYEPVTFEFVGIKRGSRFYTPDFRITKLEGLTEFHEVKGYMDSKSATKLKRMKKYHPSETVELIDAKRYRAIARTASAFIPNWEARR